MTPFSFAFNVACIGLDVTEQNHNNRYYQLYGIQNSDASIQLLTALAQSSAPAWTNCHGAAAHTDN
jgi:cytidylate kinase